MSFAHVIPYLGRNFGGQVMAMASMVNGIAAEGYPVSIFSTQKTGDGEAIHLPPEAAITLSRDAAWGSFRHSESLWSAMDNAAFSLIHSHGLWTDVHRLAAKIAARKTIPHLLGPCGMLEPNALRRSWWKKQFALFLFQQNALKNATCLLANSTKEYEDIREFGLTNPIAILPNPIPGPDSVTPVSAKEMYQKYSFWKKKKTILFLGRIHPVKGLNRLVKAWSQLQSFHDEWQLVLAGPDEGGHKATIKTLVNNLNCGDSIHFLNSLDDQWKWTALHLADLFVMPSDFENFGISIAEAMLAGKPVITTIGTPWQILAEQQAGWWVKFHPEALTKALTEAMSLPAEVRHEMGERAKSIALQFSPTKVSLQLIFLYKWLLNLGDRPDFVREG
ncbi:MAG: glycosyltransferase [Desulfuromonadaceae bacterium]|nr:glycosyltransferase [Desulfuromonadaceae bacterium]